MQEHTIPASQFACVQAVKEVPIAFPLKIAEAYLHHFPGKSNE